jgi:CubicO group peptidase (beta-lactamase class C family)
MPRLFAVVALALLCGCARSARSPATVPAAPDRAARVAEGLLPIVHVEGAPLPRLRLGERMSHYRVPGVSVAVADGGAITWARGFGVARAGTTRAVTPATLFQAGSVSKPVTATATLRLVDQGKLALDEDVNTYLRSWKVPDNDFTATEKVTLRRILSHSAGTTVHGFPGYPAGAPLPTVPQILDGAPPANTEPVRVDFVPGSGSRYSGGGVTIEQLVLTDVTGRSFPDLTTELVLRPLRMNDSTFEEPLPEARAAFAASAHDGKGEMVPGGSHVYPEMAAAGLWTTPSDLLRWAIAIAAARAGQPGAILSRATATAMLTVQKKPFGLGPQLWGEGVAFNFGHDGVDEGFITALVYFPATGKGAAVMTNGARGGSLGLEILEAIAADYGWPGFTPRTLAAVKVNEAMLEALVGTYEGPFEGSVLTVTVRREGARLVLSVPSFAVETEMVYTQPDTITALDTGEEIHIVAPCSGCRASALRNGDLEVTRKEARPLH